MCRSKVSLRVCFHSRSNTVSNERNVILTTGKDLSVGKRQFQTFRKRTELLWANEVVPTLACHGDLGADGVSQICSCLTVPSLFSDLRTLVESAVKVLSILQRLTFFKVRLSEGIINVNPAELPTANPFRHQKYVCKRERTQRNKRRH